MPSFIPTDIFNFETSSKSSKRSSITRRVEAAAMKNKDIVPSVDPEQLYIDRESKRSVSSSSLIGSIKIPKFIPMIWRRAPVGTPPVKVAKNKRPLTALVPAPQEPERMFSVVASDSSLSTLGTPTSIPRKREGTDQTMAQVEIAKKLAQYLIEVYQGKNFAHEVFLGIREPPISFVKYVERLIHFTNQWAEECDGPESFGVRCAVLAVEFIERAGFILTSRSIHRCYQTAFLIAIKFLYDYFVSMSFWAEVAGCPTLQVTKMEVEFCRHLKWDFRIQYERHSNRFLKLIYF